MNARVLAEIDDIAQEGIRAGAYPGCQIVVLKDGNRVYDKCFGTHTGSNGRGKPAREADGRVRHSLP